MPVGEGALWGASSQGPTVADPAQFKVYPCAQIEGGCNSMQIMIFTTGGTIDKVYFDGKGGYKVGAPMVRDILSHGRAEDGIEVRELLRKDSLEMTEADRLAIRDSVAGWEGSRVIVTHGTDTMVETARVLSKVSHKTIVLTGALQPGRFADSRCLLQSGNGGRGGSDVGSRCVPRGKWSTVSCRSSTEESGTQSLRRNRRSRSVWAVSLPNPIAGATPRSRAATNCQPNA